MLRLLLLEKMLPPVTALLALLPVDRGVLLLGV
jgi:hypothetical protein